MLNFFFSFFLLASPFQLSFPLCAADHAVSFTETADRKIRQILDFAPGLRGCCTSDHSIHLSLHVHWNQAEKEHCKSLALLNERAAEQLTKGLTLDGKSAACWRSRSPGECLVHRNNCHPVLRETDGRRLPLLRRCIFSQLSSLCLICLGMKQEGEPLLGRAWWRPDRSISGNQRGLVGELENVSWKYPVVGSPRTVDENPPAEQRASTPKQNPYFWSLRNTAFCNPPLP